MNGFIEIYGQKLNKSTTDFCFEWPTNEIEDWGELKKLSNLPNLTSVSFSGTKLDDQGLSLISQYKNIERLDIQDTDVTNYGISHLQNLKKLHFLRLKGNIQLTNSCVPFLNLCPQLTDLHIHETSINGEGLNELTLPGLKNLIIEVWENNYTFEFLKSYAAKYPQCTILAKGYGEFFNGNFEGDWKG